MINLCGLNQLTPTLRWLFHTLEREVAPPSPTFNYKGVPMKVFVLLVALFILSCSEKMEDINVTDMGTKQIGENLFLKKINLSNGDRIYLIIDKDGNLAGKGVSVSHTYTRQNGKSIITEIESNAHFQE